MYESGEEWSFAKLLIYLCINMTESYTYNPKSLRILWVEQLETKTRLFFRDFPHHFGDVWVSSPDKRDKYWRVLH